MLRRLLVPLALLLVAEAASPAAERPRLLLLLTIDQGRGEYLERFRPLLRGGIGRILERGVVFSETHHFHADTVTGPGHASLATGVYPSHSGIVANDWFDRVEGRRLYCMEDPEAPILLPGSNSFSSPAAGRSPKNLLVTGLGDWLKSESPDSKVFSLGAKDRAAVLMGARQADAAYWFDLASGQWVSSRYYLESYPEWVQAIHHERPADGYFGQNWTPLPVDEADLRKMEIVDVGGTDDGSFPRAFGNLDLQPGRRLHNAIFNSPFIEKLLLDFAERLVREEGLGQDETTDILALSFASVDTVGHGFGPNSREVLDTFLRLDRELGVFFDFLEETVGLDRVAVSLSGDHGAAPLPEFRRSKQEEGGRFWTDDFQCFQNAGKSFEKRFGRDAWFLSDLHFNETTLGRRGVERETVERELARLLSACPSVARVWTRSEMTARDSDETSDEPTLELYRHSFHPDRSPDLFVQPRKWHIDRRRGTTHGSPYDYDTHVAGVILWPGIAPKRVTERIHTVDLPVTLGSLLGVSLPESLDGQDLTSLLEPAAR